MLSITLIYSSTDFQEKPEIWTGVRCFTNERAVKVSQIIKSYPELQKENIALIKQNIALKNKLEKIEKQRKFDKIIRNGSLITVGGFIVYFIIRGVFRE